MTKEGSKQLTFVLPEEHDEFLALPSLTDFVYGKELLSQIEQRKLWQGKPRGQVLYLDYSLGEFFCVVNPHSFQVANDLTISGIENSDTKYSGFLLVIRNDEDDYTKLNRANILSVVVPRLKKQSPVYVLEEVKKKFAPEEIKEREKLLKEVGLVEIKVLRGLSKEYSLWEGRLIKRRKPPRPIDLTSADRGEKLLWLRKGWEEMEKKYKKAGFKIMDPGKSEILGALRSSRYPLMDIKRMQNGFGVVLVNTRCGECKWKIGLDGGITKIIDCGDASCDELHVLRQKVV